MNKKIKNILGLLLILVLLLNIGVGSYAAEAPVNLGTTSSFAVLAGSTITNTGSTTINGDVGLYPGISFTGGTSVTIEGDTHIADAVAQTAQTDLVAAYNDAAGRTPVTTIDTELGDKTLLPGVYASNSGTFEITGELTLDAQGDPEAVFIFQTETTLITAVNSEISLINEARFCRVFWQVGSSATLEGGSHFVGHLFALESITVNQGATIQGQLLARDGAVTLNNNSIINGFCAEIPVETAMEVAKTGSYDDANKDGLVNLGDKIDYTITVKNTGNIALSGVVVEDPLLGVDLTVETIPVGETWSHTGSYDITQADIDRSFVVNTVTVNEKEASVKTLLKQTSEMEVAKAGSYDDANKDGVVNLGDKIDYTITIKNTGNIALSGVVVEDPLLGLDLIVETIAVGETWAQAGSYNITQADINSGSVVNTVMVNEKEASVKTLLKQTSEMEVAKTGSYDDANKDGLVNLGDKIDYTITIKNTGNIALSGVVVEDPLLGLDLIVETIAVGETWAQAGSYNITQADINSGSVVNTVMVNEKEASVKTLLKQTSEMEVAKTGSYDDANKDGLVNLGDKIDYTITVKNTGNIALSGVVVEDPLLGVDLIVETIAVGETWTQTGSYDITQADINSGSVVNTVMVNEKEASVKTLLKQTSEMEVAKTGSYDDANKDGLVNLGDKIDYTITVKNTGNIALSGVVVEDPLLGLDLTVETIPVGETWSHTGSYDITQADINSGSVVNTVMVNEKEVSVETLLKRAPKLTINKTADKKTFSTVGEKITYSYLVTNTGNVTIGGPFLLTDDKIARIDMTSVPKYLVPKASFTVKAVYTVTKSDLEAGFITNLVKATGIFDAKKITAEDKKTIEAARSKDKTLIKTGEDLSSKILLISLLLSMFGGLLLISAYKKNSYK